MAPGPPLDAGRLLVLVGPTAAGKSGLAMALCDAVGGEIVSADSVQVYRGLDIGSAKPTAAEQARTPHHCIDLVSPDDQLDAASWAEAADAAIADVRRRGRRPVVVGGTGLYIRALLHGLVAIPDIDAAVRAAVRAEVADRGAAVVHGDLKQVDPVAAERIAPNDGQRVGRALEVYRSTGRPLSAWQEDHRFAPERYPAARVVGLWPQRQTLYDRIDDRAATMMAGGLVAEVQGLLDAGVSATAPGLRAMGYREVVEVLTGQASGDNLLARVARSHRRYARRQLVWFRGVTTREDALEHRAPDDPALPADLEAWLVAS